ncbi:MAG: hypothetical protein U1E43_08160 [Rhodospirillales bacterium]
MPAAARCRAPPCRWWSPRLPLQSDGLAVGGAAKAYGELSGSETIDGAAERTAQEIADKIRLTAERQGWI